MCYTNRWVEIGSSGFHPFLKNGVFLYGMDYSKTGDDYAAAQCGGYHRLSGKNRGQSWGQTVLQFCTGNRDAGAGGERICRGAV